MVLLQRQNLSGRNQLSKIIETNQVTAQFGLTLSEQGAELILEERNNTLREQKRVEFGESILPKLIYEFCDSVYIDQSNYAKIIIRCRKFFSCSRTKCRMKLRMTNCCVL